MAGRYDLVIEGLKTRFFPPKALQLQKKYLCQGLFKPRDFKIREFIFCINNIFKYLEHLPPFIFDQGLPNDEIIEFVEFELPHKCKIQLLVQGLNSAAKILTEIVEFCDHFNMVE